MATMDAHENATSQVTSKCTYAEQITTIPHLNMYTERTIIHESPSKLNPIDRNQLTATKAPSFIRTRREEEEEIPLSDSVFVERSQPSHT